MTMKALVLGLIFLFFLFLLLYFSVNLTGSFVKNEKQTIQAVGEWEVIDNVTISNGKVENVDFEK